MSRGELRRLGHAAQDPAVTFVALVPLALLHLSGRARVGSGAYSLVEELLRPLGEWANPALAVALVLLAFWSIGRIRRLELPWLGGSAFMLLEGALWGSLMGPILVWLTAAIAPGTSEPLSSLSRAGAALGEVHASLALAAGAGLYEELLFRAGLLSGLAVLFRYLLVGLGWREAATTAGFGFALILSAAVFALAHHLGDPEALETRVLAFRFLAGVLLGGLYAWRGLGVVAYAHAAYDAYLLL